jgi:hypothetical protein
MPTTPMEKASMVPEEGQPLARAHVAHVPYLEWEAARMAFGVSA